MIDPRKTMTERIALSVMRKFNTENAQYSYKSAILLEALFRAYKVLGDESILRYIKGMLDYYVPQDGVVRTYKLEAYSMDQVRMGNIMLSILDLTGERKYRTAVDMFMHQLETQPRTQSGGFWHKGGYPNQMWLDGLYMQAPFRVGYCKRFGGLAECLEDTINQFELIYEKTLDSRTGLLRHAWDESVKMPWCESDGRSQEVWARALGWYVMALADLLEIVPNVPDYSDFRSRTLNLANKIAPAILRFQDKDSGMWWQVMDKANVGKNYLETSATSMFIYFFAKMNRLGLLDDSYLQAAQRAFDGMVLHSVTTDEEGEVFLHDTCQSAGLGVAPGGKVYRPADFKYYTEGEPRVTDNLHGVSPFLSAAVELEFPAQLNCARYTLKEDDDLNKVLSECAKKSAVVIPQGHFTVGPIVVPSHTHLIFEEGAVLDFTDDFDAYPPIWTRWEGVYCWAMQPCMSISKANDVVVEGSGVLDGHGKRWWDHILPWKNGGRPALQILDCEKRLAALNPNYLNEPEGGGGRPCQFLRPPLLQIIDSDNVRIDGITLTHSPFWTCHPVCVTNLHLYNIKIDNPYDSPNTDGIDIESCVNVYVRGCDVNVGDDGIAVKCGSGKEMMAFQRSENIIVENCTVRNAHGGFVIGSETASGVKGAFVKNCRFIGTDRGIRIKTRRGRGGHMEGIVAQDIFMDDVICPISINMYYRCGSNEPWLYSLEKQPVDDATPMIRDVLIERVKAINCRSAAAFLAGIPEMPLQDIMVRDSSFEVKEELEPGLEAEMCSGLPESDFRGIRVINADAKFENVKVNTDPMIKYEEY